MGSIHCLWEKRPACTLPAASHRTVHALLSCCSALSYAGQCRPGPTHGALNAPSAAPRLPGAARCAAPPSRRPAAARDARALPPSRPATPAAPCCALQRTEAQKSFPSAPPGDGAGEANAAIMSVPPEITMGHASLVLLATKRMHGLTSPQKRPFEAHQVLHQRVAFGFGRLQPLQGPPQLLLDRNRIGHSATVSQRAWQSLHRQEE
jgi:hypothetical protein